MTADELFQLADRLAEKPRQWVESGPAADSALSSVMFLGFERALRQYSAILELLRKGLCDDGLVLVRSLYELNVNLSAVKSEEDAEKFLRFGKFQQARLIQQQLEDELTRAEREMDLRKSGEVRQRLKEHTSRLESEFGEFKLRKGGWGKSWSGESVETLAQKLARDTGAPRGQNDYWIYRLGSLFTHNDPGALLTGVNENELTADAWKELRLKRDKASRQGLAPILHEGSICFVDIVGMAGPYIQGYERQWFDDAMQNIARTVRWRHYGERLKR